VTDATAGVHREAGRHEIMRKFGSDADGITVDPECDAPQSMKT
jgi:hypothetical protein